MKVTRLTCKQALAARYSVHGNNYLVTGKNATGLTFEEALSYYNYLNSLGYEVVAKPLRLPDDNI